jgi:hypothetical protein
MLQTMFCFILKIKPSLYFSVVETMWFSRKLSNFIRTILFWNALVFLIIPDTYCAHENKQDVYFNGSGSINKTVNSKPDSSSVKFIKGENVKFHCLDSNNNLKNGTSDFIYKFDGKISAKVDLIQDTVKANNSISYFARILSQLMYDDTIEIYQLKICDRSYTFNGRIKGAFTLQEDTISSIAISKGISKHIKYSNTANTTKDSIYKFNLIFNGTVLGNFILDSSDTKKNLITDKTDDEKNEPTKFADSILVNIRYNPEMAFTFHSSLEGTIMRTKAENPNSRIDTINEYRFCCNDTVIIKNKNWCKHKFEFRGYLFSDFVGVNDDQPNGLLQTNIYFCFTRPVKQYPVDRKNNGVNYKIAKWYLFKNIVVTDITLSKMGLQDRELAVRYDSTLKMQNKGGYLNRFDLLQYANVITMTKVNVVSLNWKQIASCYIDVMPIYYSTLIADTLRTNKATNVSNIAFGANIKLKTEPVAITKSIQNSTISAEISFSIFWPRLYSDYYIDKAAYQIKEPSIQNSLIVSNKCPKSIQAIDLRVEYSPDIKNRNTSIYFRFSIYNNVFRNYSSTVGNVFAQFQLGIYLDVLKYLEDKVAKNENLMSKK